MRQISQWLLAASSLIVCSEAVSQDLFKSSNSTTHSYNYIEVQYLLGIETSPPVLGTLLIDVTDEWSFKAEYRSLDFGDVGNVVPAAAQNNFAVTLEAIQYSVGGLYHTPSVNFDQSDWVMGFMLGRSEQTVDLTEVTTLERFSIDDTFSFQEVYAGVRRTLSPKLEGEATVNFYRTADFDDLTLDVKLVYRAIDNFDVALSANQLVSSDEFQGSDILGIGLRYTW
jgi:hypothetical protein